MPDPKSEYRDLGMDRRIDRRDFLNGVAVGVGALSTALHARPASAASGAQSTQSPTPDAYPPRRFRGCAGSTRQRSRRSAPSTRARSHSSPASTLTPGKLRPGDRRQRVVRARGHVPLGQRALGATQRVLILDNHDDFGGHAKRNEFVYNGRTFLSFGGTMSIATPYPYSYYVEAAGGGSRH